MSDIEEPPLKVLKLGDKNGAVESLDPEEEDGMEEGQEEWLSEGVLTDDDYNPGAETLESNAADLGVESQIIQDEATPSLDDSMEQLDNTENEDLTSPPGQNHQEKTLIQNLGTNNTIQESDLQTQFQGSIKIENDNLTQQFVIKVLNNDDQTQGNESKQVIKSEVQNIEETLNNFESKSELPDDLDTFLVRKVKIESIPEKKEADDGNDTDELLRMLGEDNSKIKKKMVKKGAKPDKDGSVSSDDDDDEFIFQGAKVKTLRVAKNALIKKRTAQKAESEDMSEDFTDASSDEGMTVKKMFGVKTNRSVASKSTAKSSVSVQPARPLVKHSVNVNRTSVKVYPPAHSTPLKQYTNKNLQSKSILKPTPAVDFDKPAEVKLVTVMSDTAQKVTTIRSGISKLENSKSANLKLEKSKSGNSKLENSKSASLKLGNPKSGNLKLEKSKSLKPECEEIIDEEEFLEDEEDFELDEEEFAEDSDLDEDMSRQRIMRPERMDEEVPTDGDTHSEDGSLYDELPSSDSEDLDDWFTLDIRAERAGDYLPLLGAKARELLLEEKRRVSARLSSLRQSASALTQSGRKQADQLREATIALAELDDMLRAA